MAQLSAVDGLDVYYKQLGQIKDFHKRNPNEKVESLERMYEIRLPEADSTDDRKQMEENSATMANE